MRGFSDARAFLFRLADSATCLNTPLQAFNELNESGATQACLLNVSEKNEEVKEERRSRPLGLRIYSCLFPSLLSGRNGCWKLFRMFRIVVRNALDSRTVKNLPQDFPPGISHATRPCFLLLPALPEYPM